MLVWSTQIPIIPSRTTDELLAVSKKWLVGSPHSPWQETDFGDLPTQDLATISLDGQCVSVAKFSNSQGEFCGFRHEWQDNERRNWTTDICGWRTAQRFLTSVQLFCEVSELGSDLPQPKKPYIVRQLIEELGGDLDGSFAVSDTPILLAETEIDLAARLLRGETGNLLPVIYASSTWRNEPAFDSTELAKWASGMAHVIVEPSRRFSFVLASHVDRTNPYEGAVAICWPHSRKQVRLFPYHFDSSREYAAEITDVVRQALAGSRPDSRCTWAFLRELVFAHRIETLRREGKTSIEEYVSTFDAELAATRKQLENAEQEIGRLKGELARSQQTFRSQGDGPLNLGSEQDLYSGEHRDTLIFALGIARDHVFKDGRVRHILDATLDANKPTGERERLQKAIKDAVDGCTNIDSKERRALEELGFSMTEDGKHRKLVFRGDDRYTFAAAKSGSDWRGMKNWISDTLRNLFK